MSTTLSNAVPGWYIEFQTALLSQAPRPGEIDQTTAERWIRNQKGLKDHLAHCLLPRTPVVSVQPTKSELLLEPVGTVTVSATNSKFVAIDMFVVNTGRDAPVKISRVWDNFARWFLSGNGKTEDSISEQTLCYQKLRKPSVDGPIITELGGMEKSETTLTEMFYLMEKQKNGEDGVLLKDGYVNIFYIRDQYGVLRAVRLAWDDVGWSVNTNSITYLHKWLDGGQVFSRNSVLESSGT